MGHLHARAHRGASWGNFNACKSAGLRLRCKGARRGQPGRHKLSTGCWRRRRRSAMVALVVACLSALLARAASVATPPSHFHLAGDYLLGGLFPLHAEATTHPFRARSWVPVCTQYPARPVGYSYLQAMRYAVEEVNNSSALLPGVLLGYEMVDICYHANPVHPLLYFLSDHRSLLEVQANYTLYRPRIVALIGPDTSSTAVTAAYLCSQFFVPQLSYSATKDSLSNPRIFPSAFRTIPSTEQQVVLLLKLLRSFRWNWVVVLYSEDEYGQTNLHQLRTQAVWACIAFQEGIPVAEKDQPALVSAAQKRIRATVEKIKGSSAKVVLVLSTDVPLWPFFREAVRQNATGFVWIAAEAWNMDPTLREVPGIARLGTFFGIAPEEVPIPGLNDFRVRLSAHPSGGAEEGPDPAMCNRACDDCLLKAREADPSLRGAGSRIDFNVYSAVYAVAHALHRLLGCNATGCLPSTIYPWQVKVPSYVRNLFWAGGGRSEGPIFRPQEPPGSRHDLCQQAPNPKRTTRSLLGKPPSVFTVAGLGALL